MDEKGRSGFVIRLGYPFVICLMGMLRRLGAGTALETMSDGVEALE